MNAHRQGAYYKTSAGTILLVSVLSLLIGCAQVNTQFDCPHTRTGVCASMTDVYKMANNGELARRQGKSNAVQHASTQSIAPRPLSQRSTQPINAIVSPALRTPLVSTSVSLAPQSAPQAHPIRHQETVMPIWIAPFEDREGNYHQETLIFKVIKPGYWSGDPVMAIDDLH